MAFAKANKQDVQHDHDDGLRRGGVSHQAIIAQRYSLLSVRRSGATNSRRKVYPHPDRKGNKGILPDRGTRRPLAIMSDPLSPLAVG